MDVGVALAITVAVLLVLLVFECPVAFALGISGLVGLVLLFGLNVAVQTLAAAPFRATSNYAYVVVPLFVLMGMFAMHGDMGSQVFEVAKHHFRRVPGALGVATVLACAGFAAVTGSSLATVATVGRMGITEMRKAGYSDSFAAAIVASAGTLGVIIPPSIILVLYGIIAGESIGQMLVAGLIPGILSAFIYILYILYKGRDIIVPEKLSEHHWIDADSPKSLEFSPPDRKTLDVVVDSAVPRRTTARLPYRGLVRVAILFLIVVGGIYTGIFSATEASAVGALVAFFLMILEMWRSNRGDILSRLKDALEESASTTSMAFAVLIGSSIFTYFLVAARVPNSFLDWSLALDVPPMVIVAIILLTLIPLGMVLDPISILVITVPIAHPVITTLGYDGIWFGVLIVKLIELGLITPPIGINAYVVAGSVPNLKLETVFKGIIPFAVLDLSTIALLVAFPSLVTWLPTVMGT